MIVRQVKRGGDVKSRFVPEKWQAQKGSMQKKDSDKNNGKNKQWRELSRRGGVGSHSLAAASGSDLWAEVVLHPA